MRIATGAVMAIALAVLAGCEREVILPGTRYDIRTPLEASLPKGENPGAAAVLVPEDTGPVENRKQAISVGGAVSPSSWPQRALNPTHQIPNLAFSGGLAPVFSVPIGVGEDRRHRLTADPVSDGARLYTLDSQARVSAFTLGGAPVWTAQLVSDGDSPDQGSGGGMAVSGGRLYVTSGFATLTALDASTGGVIWTQKIGALGKSAPTVVGGTVYVIGLDNRAWAVDAANGRVKWVVAGVPAAIGYVGSGGAAVDGQIAVLPFTSGGLTAVLRDSGVRTWGTQLVGQRLGKVYATVTDIASDPVLAGDTLYAANSSGRLMRANTRDGEPLWTATEGALSPILVAGGSIFLVSDNAEVVRLDASNGQRVWGTALPDYVDPRPRKRKAAYDHFGPLLVSGRLLVASSDGYFRLYDPASGNLIGTAPLAGGAASNPIVIRGVLYIVTKDGRLSAFR